MASTAEPGNPPLTPDQLDVQQLGFDIAVNVDGSWWGQCRRCFSTTLNGRAQKGRCCSLRAAKSHCWTFHQSQLQHQPRVAARLQRSARREAGADVRAGEVAQATRHRVARVSSPLPPQAAAGVDHPSPQRNAVPRRDVESESSSLPSHAAASSTGTSVGSLHLAREPSPGNSGSSPSEGGPHSVDESPPEERRFRKGSGAWLQEHRHDPMAKHSSMSILQLCYQVAWLRLQGLTKVATTTVCRLVANVIHGFANTPNAIAEAQVPASTHLVEKVLGVESPDSFEFGWCPGPHCGHRYPSVDPSVEGQRSREDKLKDTCPNCGTRKYKVLSTHRPCASCVLPMSSHWRYVLADTASVAGRRRELSMFLAAGLGLWCPWSPPEHVRGGGFSGRGEVSLSCRRYKPP